MVTAVTSTHNRLLKLYRSLEKRKERQELGLWPLEGVRLVQDAHECGAYFRAVLLREGLEGDSLPFLSSLDPGTEVCMVEKHLFDRTAFTDSPQGVMAIARRPCYEPGDIFSRSPALVLVVDGIQDPGNLGTMIRSAAASGAGGAILLPGTVDIANPKTLRATMGAVFCLPVVEMELPDLLSEMAQRGIGLLATAGTGAVPYETIDWCQSFAVVVGNEGRGVSTEVAAAAAHRVAIPMTLGIESLNAAVAMSVIFFEAARQRRALQLPAEG